MIGTATGRWDRYIVVETPLPWKANVAESACFPLELGRMAKEAEAKSFGVRVQGVVPDSAYSLPGHRRLIHLVRPTGAFARFAKEEYLIPEAHVAAAVQALILSDQLPESLDQYRQAETSARDILVCTHGSRDACCGSLGVGVYNALRERAKSIGKELRVWRASHLGGHRFAPTLLELPEMRYWGRVTPDLLELLIDRNIRADVVRTHYRGWAGLRTPAEQVAEREVLTRFGWDLAGLPCKGGAEIVDANGVRTSVRLEYLRPGGGPGPVFEAVVVRERRVVGIGSCGDEEPSEFDQYSVADLVQVTEAIRA